MFSAIRRWFIALSARMAEARETVLPDGASLLDAPGCVPAGFRHGIEFLNDPKTPMELVVSLLMRHAGLKKADATQLMLKIHTKGGALVALRSKEAASAAAERIVQEAAQKGSCVRCRAVSV
jgi:ATP-dependent Clp protease adapter protein ClpS